MLAQLLRKNRSYRRFEESKRISPETLRGLVGLASLTGSAANRQPLRYVPVSTPEGCALVFDLLGWAAYLQDWEGPAPGERPSAYLLILTDRLLSKNAQIDVGLAAQSILLGAVEQGLGGCMLGNVRRAELMERLGLDTGSYELSLVLALGFPAEKVLLEPMPRPVPDAPADGDVRYWRDENGVHHVPKRGLGELLLEIGR